ncbi:InlB B-repeat-containing protein, partial [Methanimicrococcus blatticola]
AEFGWTVDGKKFAGWTTDAAGNTPVADPFIMPAAATTVYAKWIAESDIRYTITYNPNGADGTPTPVEEIYGFKENVRIYNADELGFAKSGETFTGWNTAADGTGTTYHINQMFVIEDDLELYAQWSTESLFRVNYHPNGADNAQDTNPMIVYYKDTEKAAITPPGETETGFKKLNMKLSGWSKTTTGEVLYRASQSADMSLETSPLDLYACWTQGDYKVTYTTDGNLESDGDQLPEGNWYDEDERVDVSKGTDMIRVGYEYNGWKANTFVDVDPSSTTDTFTGDGTEYFYMPAQDVTLKAEWVDRTGETFTVMYDGNGYSGTGIPSDSTSYKYNEKVTVESHTMSYSGYNFVGWSTEQNGGTVYQQDQEFRITKDTTLYAKWSKTGGNNGGNDNGSAEVVDPEQPEKPHPPEKPDVPDKPGNSDESTPGYEDNDNAGTIALIFVIAWMTIAIAIFTYRWRDEDEKDRENR